MVAMTMILVACSGQVAPARSPLPDVAGLADSLEPCAFTIGPGRGVSVITVTEGGPSEGHLEPGDLIVAIDGTPLDDQAALLGILDQHSPGDVIVASVERSGDEIEAELSLGVNTDDPGGRPRLGVSIVTKRERVEPDDVERGSLASQSVKTVDIEGQLFQIDFDRLEVVNIGIDAPERAWQPVGDRLVTVEILDDVASLIDAGTGTDLPFPSDLTPRQVLGAIGDDIIVGSTDAAGSEVIARLTIGSDEPAWTTPIEDGVATPGLVETEPGGSRILLYLVDTSGALEAVQLLDASTGELVEGAPEAGAEQAIGGWFDTGVILVVTSTGLVTVDVDSGTRSAVTASASLANLNALNPIGDGAGVILRRDRELVFERLGEGEDATVVDNCTIGQIR